MPCGCHSVKGAVGSVVVVEVLEAVEDWVEGLYGCRQVVDGVEFVSPGAVAAFDGSVELGSFGREFVEDQALVGAGLFELGLELGAAVDLDGLHREGHFGQHLVEEQAGGSGGGAVGGLGDGPFGDRIVGGEVFDGLARRDVDEDGVDLDHAAGGVGLEPLGQAHGVFAPVGVAAPGALAQPGDGLDAAALHQAVQDPAHGRVGDLEPFVAQQRPQLGLAPHREVVAQPLHRPHQLGGPGSGPRPVRSSASGLQPARPAVQRGPADPHRPGRRLGRQPVASGLSGSAQGVSPGRCDVRGLRGQARRQPSAAIDSFV